MYLAGDFGQKADDVNAYAASAFYAVDRYASWKTEWGAFYEAGGLVLSDRYTTSNAIHQCVKLPKDQWPAYVDWLEDFEYGRLSIPRPSLVLCLDVEPAISQPRYKIGARTGRLFFASFSVKTGRPVFSPSMRAYSAV